MSRPQPRTLLAALAIACCAAFPAGAGAATVVNGDFETGDLSGWTATSPNLSGEWSTYEADSLFAVEVFQPPQGIWAAATEQGGPDPLLLYQDVAMEPLSAHTLSLFLFYVSAEPMVSPVPNSLSVAADNQQVRFDVIKPGAPIDSVAPGDILTTVFASKAGDPQTLLPTRLQADLSAFAGQTVRLRVAGAATEGLLNTGVDAVAISSGPLPPALAPIGPALPSNEFSRGKVRLTPGTGGGFLAIDVPGPGVVTAVDARAKLATASASARPKAPPKRIRRANRKAAGAGQVLVPLHPTVAGFKRLEQEGKLKVVVRVTYTPTGGLANTKSFRVTLKLAPSGGGPKKR